MEAKRVRSVLCLVDDDGGGGEEREENLGASAVAQRSTFSHILRKHPQNLSKVQSERLK